MYRDTVTVLTAATTTDRYHNSTVDWTAPTEVVTPAWVGGQSTTERTAAGDQVITALACHLPTAVAVTAANRIRWRDNDYEIDGDPLPMSRMGALHHYELTLRRVEG